MKQRAHIYAAIFLFLLGSVVMSNVLVDYLIHREKP